ncbi:MAG: hypothetical protein JNM85_08465 [Chthonomonas sp.]|nr:hypothetical protein [Chthonomonas sp.]
MASDEASPIDVTVGVSVLGKTESNAYGTLKLSRSVGNGMAVDLMGTMGSRKRFAGTGFAIRHGGSDIELRLRRETDGNASGSLGLAIASTPAGRSAPFLTLSGETRMAGNDKTSVSLVLRAATRVSSSLYGTGFRADTKLNNMDAYFEGLWVSGSENTYSINTGKREQRAVYRLGVRPQLGGKLKFELGVTNQLGRTTGMSLTPGLGKGLGGYVELTTRF